MSAIDQALASERLRSVNSGHCGSRWGVVTFVMVGTDSNEMRTDMRLIPLVCSKTDGRLIAMRHG